MAKRNKAKFASKSRKSALRVEALEQRQLLAAVTGGGTEVGSNIVHPNGNVYDQVLMTGASVTVTADAGQVTRVSFLDLSGDIVQAEFAGKGSLTITLDQFKAAAEAANYNQPGVKYVGGLATFTIQGEDSTTNFNVFSVGQGNAVNQDLFAGGKTGGNHFADVARLLIVADPQFPGGSTMGGIRAGNAIFADTSGAVGISAANVQTQGPVILGDIDASNSGVPTLKFGTASQFATLQVAGGDLVQTNGQTFAGNLTGFQSINSTAGTDSSGANVGAKVIAGGTVPGVVVVTLDATTAFDLTGKSQADIDAAFKGRTFTNDITIAGDLSGVNSLSAAEFRGAVTFTGTLSGNVTIDGAVKSITLAKAQTSGEVIKAASIGALTTSGTADLSGVVLAKSIGNVTVGGSLTGTVSTNVGDVDRDNADADNNTATGVDIGFDAGESSIGNVTIASNVSGTIFGVLGVGSVTVGGNVTTTGADFIHTSSGSSGDAFLGSVGKVTVTGDVSQAGTDNFINIAGNGTFGDVLVSGAGTNTSSHTVGKITVGGVLGAAGTAAGSISVTDNMGTGSTLTLGTISIGGVTSNNGSVGAITVTNTTGNVASSAISFTGTGSVGDVKLVGSGSSTSTGNLGAITLTTGTAGASLGNVSVTGAKTITLGALTATKVGNIDAAVTTTGTNAGAISVGAVSANNGTTNATIGNITLNAGTIAGAKVTIGGDIAANNIASNGSSSIGTVTLTAATDLTNNIAINGSLKASSIGAITHNGSTTFAAGVGYQALKSLASFTANGDTQFNTLANVAATFTTGTITGGAVNNDYAVNFAGTAYTASQTTIPLTFTGGGGTGAAGVATTNAMGQVTAVAVTAFGTGYTSAPTLSIATGVGTTAPSTAVPNIRFGGTTGPALTFNGTTRFGGVTAGYEGGQTAAILASNGGSALDAIGALTFNGKVVGVAGKTDVRASSIGNVSVTSALAQGETLVTNLNIYAGNNGVAGATSGTSTETVARDGSNLSSYSIGNITVSNTNTIGVTSTALFGGQNSFNAIGAIGNVSFTGGGSAAVQTGLGTGAFIQTGNGAVVGTGGALLNAVTLTGSGIDFDGNGVVGSVTTVTSGVFTGTDESGSVFSTGATVSIGNITVNAAPVVGVNDSVASLGGGTTGGIDGLMVLSGAARGATADYSTVVAINGNLRGTVGDVLLQNLNQQLSRNSAAAPTANDALVADTTAGLGGLIVGTKGTGTTSPVGKVQGLAFTTNATITGDNYIVGGGDNAIATNTTGELTVVIL